MSEINANIIVETNPINVQVEQSEIGITVEPINLNLYTGGFGVPGGNIGQLQYNAGILAGVPNVTYISGNLSLGNIANVKITGGSNGQAIITDGNGNLTFGNVGTPNLANFANFAGNVTVSNQPNITGLGTLTGLTVNGTSNLGPVGNVIITGGTSGYYLQTDGAGNLVWSAGGGSGNGVVGGVNTQVQFNDAGLFGGNAGFTFNKATGLLTAPSITSTGNITSGNANLGNLATANYFSGNGANLTSLTGANVTGQVTYAATANSVAGANVTGTVANATHASTANTVVNAAQSNITSLGTLTSLNVSGTTSIYEAIENVALIGAQTGTYNYDLLDGGIQYSTANATANLTINFRGNSTTTANSILSNGKSITSTYVLTNGATPYQVSAVQVDSSAQTIKWVGGISPTFFANSLQSYTFTIIKTSTTPTYTVLGSMTRYA
jgi:hypothetical protein